MKVLFATRGDPYKLMFELYFPTLNVRRTTKSTNNGIVILHSCTLLSSRDEKLITALSDSAKRLPLEHFRHNTYKGTHNPYSSHGVYNSKTSSQDTMFPNAKLVRATPTASLKQVD
jgi:hypothetical protein